MGVILTFSQIWEHSVQLPLLGIQVDLVYHVSVAVETTTFPVTDGRPVLPVCLALFFCGSQRHLPVIRLRKSPVAKAGCARNHMMSSKSEAASIDKSERYRRSPGKVVSGRD